MGYIAGAVDMGDGIVFCVTADTVTMGQVRDILKNYLEATPTTRHMSADAIIIELFKKLWPCAKRGTAL